MIAPVKKLRKKDLEWLAGHKCKHSHTYLEHYNCWLKEQPEDCPFVEKVGYFDIESTNLVATFGYMLSYAILNGNTGEMLGRHLQPKEIKNYVFDRNLMAELCEDLKKFHRIVVYYGIDNRFDLPFVRTKAIKYGLDFPLYKDVFTTDVYSYVRSKLRLHNNRMETACSTFNIESKGHRLTPDAWMKAQAGDRNSLDYIWEHNMEDVYSLKALWEKIDPYVNKGRRSI